MSVSGLYYVKKRIPNPEIIHGSLPEPPEGFMDMKLPEPPPEPKMPKVSLPDRGPCSPGIFEGEVLLDLTEKPDGTLTGTANGESIQWGYYSEDGYIKLAYSVGPGTWEICAKIDNNGSLEGIVSVGGGGYPNLAYGKRLNSCCPMTGVSN